MRKLFKKSLACVLAVALCLTAMVGALSVSADEAIKGTVAISDVVIESGATEATIPVTFTIPEEGADYINVAFLNVAAEGATITGATAGEGATDVVLNATKTMFELWINDDGNTGSKKVVANIAVTFTGTSFKLTVSDATSASNTEKLIEFGTATKEFTAVVTHEHVLADAVIENNVPATCYAGGSYDSVVYCTAEGCDLENNEYSRETITVPATGEHTPAEPVEENRVEPDCDTAGSYESVVYCSVAECKHEISRTTVTIDALGHKYVDGACTVCGEEDPNYEPPVEECEHDWNVTESVGAQYDGTQGSLVMNCTKCDATVDADVEYGAYYFFYTTNATYGDEITVNFKAINDLLPDASEYEDFVVVLQKAVAGSDTPKTLVFDRDDATSGGKSGSYNLIQWTMPIAAKEMNDIITANMFVKQNGVWYNGAAMEKSFVNYALEIFAKNTGTANGEISIEEKALVANAMQYGGKAQLNFEYDMENPAYNHIPAEYVELVKTEAPEMTALIDESIDFSSDKVIRYTSFIAAKSKAEFNQKMYTYNGFTDIENLKFVVSFTNYQDQTITTEIVHESVATEEQLANEEYFYFSENLGGALPLYAYKYTGVSAKDMRRVVEFTPMYNGEQIGATVSCSLEALMADVISTGIEQVEVDMYYAMLNYGDAAEAFFIG